MHPFSTRDEIIETVNKLLVYTDQQQWDLMQQQVFADKVQFDMSSLGGPKEEMEAKAICEMWRSGFADIDAVNHLAGNYLVQAEDNKATVFAYATATHYKAAATKGQTREFVGTYNIDLIRQPNGWRITAFQYLLKFTTGNRDLS